MIYTFLQRNFITAVILLLLIAVALWLPYSINPVMDMHVYDSYPMPLYKPLLQIFQYNPYIGLLLQFACIGFSIFVLSNINSQFRLIEKRSSFYISLGILFAVLFPEYQQFNPMMFAGMLVLLGFFSLFKLYKNEYNLRYVYEAGLLFSTAGLIYINVYFLTLIVFCAIIILIPFNWRQWVSAIFGIATPLFFIFSWILVFNKFDYFLFILQHNTIFVHNVSKSLSTFSYLNMIIIVFFALLFCISIGFVFFGNTVKKIVIHKYYALLLLFFVFAALCYIAIPWVGVDIFYFCILPAIFFIANYITNLRSRWLPDVLSIVMFVLVLIAKFI
ncbi:MAG: hypothetical protein LBR55_03395 [Bacteroidales bacterium]|jgi:hypothetical protein|nr:hypothetical protein [Bacteroidales bacterium]